MDIIIYILDNELVNKYLGCEAQGIECTNGNEYLEHISYRILKAMQEPIKKGERYLVTHNQGITWEESILTGYPNDENYHPYLLRLPDRFQKEDNNKCNADCVCYEKKPKSETEKCDIKLDFKTQECGCYLWKHEKENCKLKTVEEKIKEIIHEFKWSGTPMNRKYDALRELVELVRKNK